MHTFKTAMNVCVTTVASIFNKQVNVTPWISRLALDACFQWDQKRSKRKHTCILTLLWLNLNM